MNRTDEYIDAYCKQIAECWKKSPHLRFGQFIYMIMFMFEKKKFDPFYVNDDELMNFMIKYTREEKNGDPQGKDK